MSIQVWKYLTATRNSSVGLLQQADDACIPIGPSPTTVDLFNAAGQDGWELVDTYPERDEIVYVFKHCVGPRQQVVDIHEVGDP